MDSSINDRVTSVVSRLLRDLQHIVSNGNSASRDTWERIALRLDVQLCSHYLTLEPSGSHD